MSDLAALFGGMPEVGELDQAFVLLTVASSGAVDTCLLSRMEVRPGVDGLGLAAVVVSRRARANLAARPVATLIAVGNDEMHTLTCSVAARVDAEGASAFALQVTEHRRDGLGIELIPMRYRVDEKLRVAERWDRTDKLLAMLDAARTTAPGSGRG